MIITFSSNPIDRFRCWLSNKYEDLTQFRWNLKHHRIACHICGDVLDSPTISIKISTHSTTSDKMKHPLRKLFFTNTL